MTDMSRESYLAALKAIGIADSDATFDRLATIAPHLTAEQIQEALDDRQGSNIATPPVMVSGAYQLANIVPNVVNGTLQMSIGWRGGRTRDSYANPDRRQGDDCAKIRHVEEAISYAREHWDDQLIVDNWHQILEIRFQDPEETDNDKKPTTKQTVWLAVEGSIRMLSCLHKNGESWDEHVKVVTVDPIEVIELRGNHGIDSMNYCWICGAGLRSKTCDAGHGPKSIFGRPSGMRHPPLPQSVIKLVEQSGHVFQDRPAYPVSRKTLLV